MIKNKHNSKILMVFAFSLIMVLTAFTFVGCSFGDSKKAAGIYDDTGKLTYSWEKLIENQIFAVSGTILSKGEKSDSEIIVGSLVLPDDITEIGDYVCNTCSGLKSVTIPENVTRIGELAFAGCSGLTSITIPNKITEIGRSAFSGCTGLTNVKIGNGVTKINRRAFSGCTGLTNITIPNSVTEIGANVFDGCENLIKVKFENAEGWKAGATPLDSTYVANEGKAASMITDEYASNTWNRA